jgi:hypothetical protein
MPLRQAEGLMQFSRGIRLPLRTHFIRCLAIPLRFTNLKSPVENIGGRVARIMAAKSLCTK